MVKDFLLWRDEIRKLAETTSEQSSDNYQRVNGSSGDYTKHSYQLFGVRNRLLDMLKIENHNTSF